MFKLNWGIQNNTTDFDFIYCFILSFSSFLKLSNKAKNLLWLLSVLSCLLFSCPFCVYFLPKCFFCFFFLSVMLPARVRLSDGPVPNAGRVEIYSGGAWYTVCDSRFYQREAQVVCGQLGYQRSDIICLVRGDARFAYICLLLFLCLHACRVILMSSEHSVISIQIYCLLHTLLFMSV